MQTQPAKRFKFPLRIQISDDHKAFKQMNIECQQLLAARAVSFKITPRVFPEQTNSRELRTNYESIVEVFRKLGNSRLTGLNLR